MCQRVNCLQYIILCVGFISKKRSCLLLCVNMNERQRETHMVRGAMFSIKRLGDKHLPNHGVDIEDLIGRLICSHPGDAVSD